jgi:AAHS family 4-hydroxybenzoate transporter-like MFS transporter
MNNSASVPVRDLINARPMSGAQYGVVAVAAALATLDGLDSQILSFVARNMARDWHISMAALGSVFSIGLFGVMLGALIVGLLGDVLGPKRVLVWVTILAGITTILTGLAHTTQQVMVLRFLTGFGIGGSLPNAISLASQFSPKRSYGITVSIVGTGFPFGAAIGGVIAAYVLPKYGWHMAFLVAGVFPLLLAPVVLFLLPESIPALLKRTNGQQLARRVLDRVAPNAVSSDATLVWQTKTAETGTPLPLLFEGDLRYVTPLVWLMFFMSLLDVYLLANWLPTLLQEAHSTARQAIFATTGYSIAGVVGAPLIGLFIDRFRFDRVLVLTFLAAAGATVSLANATTSFPIICATAFASGFFVIGSQGGLNTIPTFLYREEARGAGTGWGLGMGRIGSIVGPFLVGIFLTRHWSYHQVLLASAIPSLVCAALLVVLMATRRSDRAVVAMAN